MMGDEQAFSGVVKMKCPQCRRKSIQVSVSVDGDAEITSSCACLLTQEEADILANDAEYYRWKTNASV